MEVTLLHSTPLFIASRAIRKCYKSEKFSDTKFTSRGKPYIIQEEIMHNGEVVQSEKGIKCEAGPKDKALIERIGNQMKHKSTLRHVQYVFECNNISTKTLLAFTRHSIGKDISVESTRFTLSKRIDELSVTYTKSEYVNTCLDAIMGMVAEGVKNGESNDDLSMLLPQGYNYSFITTMNIQSLQHFLELRTPKTAHWDIRNFANALFNQIPEEHKYLFIDSMYKEKER